MSKDKSPATIDRFAFACIFSTFQRLAHEHISTLTALLSPVPVESVSFLQSLTYSAAEKQLNEK